MSPDILKEMDFLGYTVLMGACITCLYDVFRIVRRVIKHNLFFISLEDFFFWVICSVLVFAVLYKENNGTLRWFAIMGAFAGMLLYRLTLGQILVKYISGLLVWLLHGLEKILLVLLKPAAVCAKAGKKISKKAGVRTKSLCRIGKKKLTSLVKIFKIVICKQ